MKQSFKQLNTTFNTLLLIQLLLCIGALPFILHQSNEPTVVLVHNTSQPLLPFSLSTNGILVLVFLLSAVGVTYLMDSQRKAQGAIWQGLPEKAAHYRQTSLIRLLLLEAANVFAIVIALRESNQFYLVFVAIGLLLFLKFRPTTRHFIKSYQLSEAEIAQIRG
ncbi:MAG TPA: hypothetical protein PKC76_05775 [Saprospiraceae bacterium]|nr:hypothetical protein [Saprospiraceae bacterium]HMP23619.1 hypothetical protein [Saprospiraceae bacterium]